MSINTIHERGPQTKLRQRHRQSDQSEDLKARNKKQNKNQREKLFTSDPNIAPQNPTNRKNPKRAMSHARSEPDIENFDLAEFTKYFKAATANENYTRLDMPVKVVGSPDKSDDYVYASADKPERDYEYVAVRTGRRRAESENLDSLGSSDAHEDSRQEIVVGPQSAPDLQSIATRPYDIKFLNECSTRIQQESSSDDEEKTMPKQPTSRMGVKVDKERMGPSSRAQSESTPNWSQIRKNPSVMRIILRLTPTVLFWTCCGFCVGLIYIMTFPTCPNQLE